MKRILLFLAIAGLTAAAPQVTKVEPPNWWADHTLNPVRLLIRGSGLTGASVTAEPGFDVARLSVNAKGTYLQCDLSIPSGVKPGSYPLHLRTVNGETLAPFTIEPALDPAGRFAGFSSDDVIYLIMVDRFANGHPDTHRPFTDRAQPHAYHGGDFAGIIDRLPYLKSLGITAIWLTPIYDNADPSNNRMSDYHGYGAIDYYRVEERFGDLAELRKLVDAAHAQGIKVIQDQVANHTGPLHPWVQDSPTPTWFHGTKAHHIKETWQLWTLPDPYAAANLQSDVLNGWFADVLPDLNQDDPDVARYEIQNALWWIGMAGFDGIRQDTLPYVPRSFWLQWTAALKRQYPSLRVVGEVFDADPAIPSFFQENSVDTVFDFPGMFTLRDVFTKGASMEKLSQMQAQDRLYADPMQLVTFLGNHDLARFMSLPGATLDELKLAFTFLLTTRGTPQLYYGDEIGMRGGDDPDNRHDFPGGWTGDAVNAFARRAPEQAQIFDYVQRLLELRSRYEPLRRGQLIDLGVTKTTWVYARRSSSGTALVALNNGTQPATIEVNVEADGTFEPQLGSTAPVQSRAGQLVLQLPPRQAEVYFTSDRTAPFAGRPFQDISKTSFVSSSVR